MKQIYMELKMQFCMSVTTSVSDELFDELQEIKERYHGHIESLSMKYPKAIDFLSSVDDEDATDINYHIGNITVIDG